MARDDIVDMDAEEEPTTDSLVTGITVFTFLALGGAWYLLQTALANNYDTGMLK
ncbi:MAG: hypothetical protein ACYTDX_04500 [Planctomycetota bacterium]|jgi:hypothetical protein